MQSTRDSFNVDYVEKLIYSGEEWANRVLGELVVFLESIAGELLIAYSGLGYPAATTLYWIITTFNPDKQPVVQDSDTIAFYRLVYRKRASILYFTTKPGDPALIRLGDTCRLTGGRLVIVSPPPPEILETMLRSTPLIKLPMVKSEVLAALYEIILSYKVGLRVYGGSGKRVERLRIFSKEGYSIITRELYEKYHSVIDSVRKMEQVVVTSTWFLEAPCYMIVKALRERGVRASYTPISLLEPCRGDNILLVSTSVEETVVREKRFKASITGANVLELTLNFDPLETPLYLGVLALMIKE